MKKLVSGILAGISVMSSIPNVGATHFTSETSESQSKGLDWKSALLGGSLIGGIGIPVAAVISALIGKNVGKLSSTDEGLFKLANDEYAEPLKEFLDIENYRSTHSEYCSNMETRGINFVLMAMNKINKKHKHNLEIKSSEDLDFKKVFSVYKPCHHMQNSGHVALMPNETFGYDIIMVAVVTSIIDGEEVIDDTSFIIFDFRNLEKTIFYEVEIDERNKWKWNENYAIKGALEFGSYLDLTPEDKKFGENHVLFCKGYKVGPKSEDSKAK